jgi:hypothetical protein
VAVEKIHLRRRVHGRRPAIPDEVEPGLADQRQAAGEERL